jgi:hypothetical protein
MNIDAIPNVTLPVIPWENNGETEDDDSALLSWVRIFGIDYHVEAIAVDQAGNALLPEAQEKINALADINGSYGDPFHTVEMNDKRYVVYFYPFAT